MIKPVLCTFLCLLAWTWADNASPIFDQIALPDSPDTQTEALVEPLQAPTSTAAPAEADLESKTLFKPKPPSYKGQNNYEYDYKGQPKPYEPPKEYYKPYEPPKEYEKPYEPPKAYQKPYEPPKEYQKPYEPPQEYQKPYEPPKAYQKPYEPPKEYQKPYEPPKEYQKPYEPPKEYQKPYEPPKVAPKPYEPPKVAPKPYEPPKEYKSPGSNHGNPPRHVYKRPNQEDFGAIFGSYEGHAGNYDLVDKYMQKVGTPAENEPTTDGPVDEKDNQARKN